MILAIEHVKRNFASVIDKLTKLSTENERQTMFAEIFVMIIFVHVTADEKNEISHVQLFFPSSSIRSRKTSGRMLLLLTTIDRRDR